MNELGEWGAVISVSHIAATEVHLFRCSVLLTHHQHGHEHSACQTRMLLLLLMSERKAQQQQQQQPPRTTSCAMQSCQL
jgi:hypothetical protein